MNFFDHVEHKMTEDMESQLVLEFTIGEISIALNHMHPTKVSGPNNMASPFFQKYWGMVGLDVTKVVLLAHNTSTFPNYLNHTYITLITKEKCPGRLFTLGLLVFLMVYIKLWQKSLPTS